MSDAKRRYLRLYFDDLELDHPDVWFDPTCLSTFVRLLALSEKAWPAMPELPRAVRRADLDKLATGGMIEYLDNHRFVLRGWVAERSKRADIGRTNVGKRADRTSVPTTVDTTVSTTVVPVRARAAFASSISVDTTEGVQGEPFPHIDPEAQTFLEGVTGRLIRQAGDKQLAEYDRQIEAHGLPAVIAAYRRCAKLIPGTPTATQLVWSGRKVLEPFVDPKAVAAEDRSEDDAKRARKRDEAIWQRRIEAYQSGGKWDPAWGDPPVAA